MVHAFTHFDDIYWLLCSRLLSFCFAYDVCDAFESDCEFNAQGGLVALICAAASGRTDCVRLLIDAGANKEAKNNVRVAHWHCLLLVSFFPSSLGLRFIYPPASYYWVLFHFQEYCDCYSFHISLLFFLTCSVFTLSPYKYWAILETHFLVFFWNAVILYVCVYAAAVRRWRIRLTERIYGADLGRCGWSRGVCAAADRCRGWQGDQEQGACQLRSNGTFSSLSAFSLVCFYFYRPQCVR